MADIRWIKITTDIFDDEKIKIIDSLPARDEILVVWFKLLALAGKVNKNGMLFMNSRIAYTPEMLATIFNRELSVVKVALNTFENFEMIIVEDDATISIANWEKHQNIDGMDKIREQNKIRQRKYREKQLQLTDNDVTRNVTITSSNAIDKDKDKDKEIRVDNKKDIDDVWLAYPRKKGKAASYKKIPKLLKTYSKDQLIGFIKAYDRSVKDKSFLMYGSTFFNSGYLDYTEEEEKPENTKPKFVAPWYKEGQKDEGYGQSN